MKTIHKYPLKWDGETQISMPAYPVFLSLQVQHGEPMLWAQVDTANKMLVRRFKACVTGGEVPPNAKYIGTLQTPDGSFVNHYFEVP